MKQLIKKNWEIIVILALFVILVIAFFPFIKSRLTENVGLNTDYTSDNRALSDRIFYNNVSRETISNNFITGSGLGTFIFQIDGYLESADYSPLEKGKGCVESKTLLIKHTPNPSQEGNYEKISRPYLEHWEYQPVHNVYLLICSEIGIVGFAIFCLIIIEILSNSVSVTRKTAKTRDL